MRLFRSLRRQRRQPKPPFYLLDLELPLDRDHGRLDLPGAVDRHLISPGYLVDKPVEHPLQRGLGLDLTDGSGPPSARARLDHLVGSPSARHHEASKSSVISGWN